MNKPPPHLSRPALAKAGEQALLAAAIQWCDETPFEERYADRHAAYRKGLGKGFSLAIQLLARKGVIEL